MAVAEQLQREQKKQSNEKQSVGDSASLVSTQDISLLSKAHVRSPDF